MARDAVRYYSTEYSVHLGALLRHHARSPPTQPHGVWKLRLGCRADRCVCHLPAAGAFLQVRAGPCMGPGRGCCPPRTMPVLPRARIGGGGCVAPLSMDSGFEDLGIGSRGCRAHRAGYVSCSEYAGRDLIGGILRVSCDVQRDTGRLRLPWLPT